MRRFIIVAVTVIAGVSVASPSFAEDDPVIVGNATGGGWVEGAEAAPPTPAEARVLEAKFAVWEAYDALTSGAITEAEYEVTFAQNAREARLLGSDEGGASALRPPPCGTVGDPCPDVSLDVPHVGQANTYYCGPASGVMIARYKGKERSAHTGARLSQAKMANIAHMHTEQTQSTPYWSGKFTRGLNKWLYGSDTDRWRYSQVGNPSVSRFKQALRWNINQWMPIGVSTVEWESDGSYNGHQFHDANTPIGHWIVARGYQDHGARVLLLDPATTVWSRTEPRIAIATSTMATVYVDNGISAT